MRIGFDAKRAFHNRSGLGNYSRFVIESLSQRYADNDYFLYTPPYKPSPMHGFAAAKNITVRQPGRLGAAFPSLWRTYRMAKAAQRDKTDIFHGLSHELPAGIEKTGIKSVVTVHDVIFLRYPEYYPAIDRTIYKKKLISACNRADLIIAISEQTKADLMEFLNVAESKIRLVYQGCDPQFYTPAPADEKARAKIKYSLPDRYVLSVGTIEERKNLLTLVRAIPSLPTDVHLVAVGKQAAYAEKVSAEIAALGLADRVKLISNANFRDFPAIYGQASAFVYPSVFEGFGIPILEALNSRVPVIAAGTSSLPEVGGNAALYIRPDDHTGLADMLNNILADSNLSARMVAEGLVQAQKFREEQTIPALWKVYEELIS